VGRQAGGRKFILWDHDGVLVDTERWYFAATRDSLADLGIQLDQAAYLGLATEGRSCWDLARQAGHSEARVELQRSRRDGLYQDYIRSQPIEIDGVLETLRELHGAYRMAIVTTARREDFALIHRSRSLLECFELIVTIEDCARPKPHPDLYLEALRRLGARAEESFAVEDSARGLRAATAAGIDCIVVKNAFTAFQDFSAAWSVLDSVRDLPGILAAASRCG
jgi:HAD superfamily hydrolase (TIGR01509 family)